MVEVVRFQDDASRLLKDLHAQFEQNLNTAVKSSTDVFDRVELAARGTATLGEILGQSPIAYHVHSELPMIFDEVFADTICSIYLSACALDNPAKAMLRRVLELGVAIVYLWDLPHRYAAWKHYDKDLSFTEMLEHLDSIEYKHFVRVECDLQEDTTLIDPKQYQKLYRTLSNTIHGKLSTFEVSKANRFQFSSEEWGAHLCQVEEVQAYLFELWAKRFPDQSGLLFKRMPQLNKA
jgi:hypothetical protein